MKSTAFSLFGWVFFSLSLSLLFCFSLLVSHCFQFSFTVSDGGTSYARKGEKTPATSLECNGGKECGREGGREGRRLQRWASVSSWRLSRPTFGRSNGSKLKVV